MLMLLSMEQHAKKNLTIVGISTFPFT